MEEQELLQHRLKELAMRARYTGSPAFTRFLEAPAEIPARTAANTADVRIRFYGGYDDAERRIAAFHTDDEIPDFYPISVLRIKWNPKYSNPGHRDLLGSLMGLGIERETLGDIVFGREAGTAYLFACEDMERYICASLESVGRTSVKIEPYYNEVQIREPEGQMLRLTVAAERLDSIIAAAYKLSRSEAQKLIESGMVRRNHVPELKSDIHPAEGDLLSVRGHGRMRITAYDETPTRKGRRVVRLFQYT